MFAVLHISVWQFNPHSFCVYGQITFFIVIAHFSIWSIFIQHPFSLELSLFIMLPIVLKCPLSITCIFYVSYVSSEETYFMFMFLLTYQTLFAINKGRNMFLYPDVFTSFSKHSFFTTHYISTLILSAFACIQTSSSIFHF